MDNPTSRVAATYTGKGFVLDHDLIELIPGQRVQITFEVPLKPPAPWPEPQRDDESFDEFIDRIAVDDPSVPTDLSAQHDHYASGAPKR